jgi:hypothetical protein
LFVQQDSCQGGVDAATHGDQNASVFTHAICQGSKPCDNWFNLICIGMC